MTQVSSELLTVNCQFWKPQHVCTTGRRNSSRREFALQSEEKSWTCRRAATEDTLARTDSENLKISWYLRRCLLKLRRLPYTASKLDESYFWLYSSAENEINQILFDFQVTYKSSVVQQTSAKSQFFLPETTFYCRNRFRQISWNDYPQMWVKSWNSTWTVHCACATNV